VLLREWVNAGQRLKDTRQLLQNLVKLSMPAVQKSA